jgi:hypothetical protein
MHLFRNSSSISISASETEKRVADYAVARSVSAVH